MFYLKCLLKKSNSFILKNNGHLNGSLLFVRKYMLETTKVKLINSYDEATEYINSLVKERNDLVTLTSNENEFNKQENKQDLFQRLNQLEHIAATYFKINKSKNDLIESIETLKTNDYDDDMKEMFTRDNERLNEVLMLLRIEMIQSLITNQSEDKENAYVEISAGVGGLESRIFCSELFEMYRLYSDYKNWTFRPLKVYTDMTGKYVFILNRNTTILFDREIFGKQTIRFRYSNSDS